MSKPKTTINLDDKIDKDSELGTLIVILLKARNLNDKHSFRKSDVFAQATLNGVQKRTHVDIKGGQRPEWDGEVRFSVLKKTGAKSRKLEVSCYSQEPRSEDLMGQGVVDITETLRTGEFDDWVPLEVDGVQRGELYLEMTYYANAPAPASAAAPSAQKTQLTALLSQNQSNLSRRPSKLSPAERLSRPHPNQVGQNQGLTQAQAYAQAHSSTPSRISSSTPAQHSRLHEEYSLQSNQARPGPSQNQTQNGVPASMRPAHLSAGSSPNGRHDSLPGGRHDTLPSNQDPYGVYASGQRPSQQIQGAQQPQGASLPDILRPGPAAGSPPSTSPTPQHRPLPGHGHVRHPSAPVVGTGLYPGYGQDQAAPSSNPYIGGNVSPPNPYIGGGASTQPQPQSQPNIYVQGSNTLSANSGLGPGRAYSPAPPPGPTPVAGSSPNAVPAQGGSYYGSHPQGTPLLWQQGTQVTPPVLNGSGFMFPTPVQSPPIQERPRQASFSGYSDPRFARPQIPPNVGYTPQQQYYQQRPPFPHKSSSQDDNKVDPYLQARYQSPLPLPPGASPAQAAAAAPTRPAPPAPAPAPAPPAKVQAASQVSTATPGPDRARVEALRKVEEEAARRREQEVRDLELAMQLDRELNLAEERAAATAGGGEMPGRWK